MARRTIRAPRRRHGPTRRAGARLSSSFNLTLPLIYPLSVSSMASSFKDPLWSGAHGEDEGTVDKLWMERAAAVCGWCPQERDHEAPHENRENDSPIIESPKFLV